MRLCGIHLTAISKRVFKSLVCTDEFENYTFKTRCIDGMPTSEVTSITIPFINPPHQLYPQQCCWNIVARSPSVTHESTGRPKVPQSMVRLATNEFFKFCRKYFGMKLDIRFHRFTAITDITASIGSFWPFFNWSHGLSRLLIDGPPRTETDHPTINHGWSIGRTRILHFPQHCHGHDDHLKSLSFHINQPFHSWD